jgi:hypothetical protein
LYNFRVLENLGGVTKPPTTLSILRRRWIITALHRNMMFISDWRWIKTSRYIV